MPGSTLHMISVALLLLLLLGAQANDDDPSGKFAENSDMRAFDDSILFDVAWTNRYMEDPNSDGHAIVDAVAGQEFVCSIPRLLENTTQSSSKDYTGKTPMQLLGELFKRAACSFRAESYWTYEVCHGDFIKQYHEERDGKNVKLQNYMLGWWSAQRTAELEQRMAERQRNGAEVPVLRIESQTLPYVELNMTDGSMCDLLSNRPRQTRVLYVCYPHGQNEVYSLKEVSTCQYEVVILTQVLCEHPSYKPLSTAELRIQCSRKLPGSSDSVYPPTAWSTYEQKLVKIFDKVAAAAESAATSTATTTTTAAEASAEGTTTTSAPTPQQQPAVNVDRAEQFPETDGDDDEHVTLPKGERYVRITDHRMAQMNVEPTRCSTAVSLKWSMNTNEPMRKIMYCHLSTVYNWTGTEFVPNALATYEPQFHVDYVDSSEQLGSIIEPMVKRVALPEKSYVTYALKPMGPKCTGSRDEHFIVRLLCSEKQEMWEFSETGPCHHRLHIHTPSACDLARRVNKYGLL